MKVELAKPASNKKSKNRQWINNLRREQGKAPLPETEDEQEVFLPVHLHWLWAAFATLSRSRHVNDTGPQPITVTDLRNYCDLEGIFDEEDRKDVLFHVMALDVEWLSIKHEEIAKAREDQRKKFEQKGKGRPRK